jgi:hypothetical protein
MNDLEKRFILFIGICIPVRFLVMYYSKTTNYNNLQYLGILYMIISLSMMYIYATDSRKTGLETFGKKIWWNDLRPIFALIYFAFAYNAIQGKEDAYKYLVYDLILGFFAFLYKHFIT